MITRHLSSQLKTHFAESKKSILLLGPRQTGKSTLVKSMNPNLGVNLAREKEYRDHLADPELIERLIRPLPKKSIIAIDEIQRIPEMLNTIQSIIDERKDIRFLLTGSSARKLRHGSANLLPGRIFVKNLYPLTALELGQAFDLDRALAVGLLPEIYLEDESGEILENYAAIYLKEEIKAEALVRNYASFSRFLDVAAHLSGQEINYSKVASDTEIPKESLRRYLEILEDTLIIHRIPSFQKVASNRKAIQKEKIIFFDVGVRNAILGIHKNKFLPHELGGLFEQFFILQVIAIHSYFRKDWKIFYYRDQHQLEVDLVIETQTEVLAIEIKFGARFQKDWLDPINEFEACVELKGKKISKIIVYRGEHPQRVEDIDIYPFMKILENLKDW